MNASSDSTEGSISEILDACPWLKQNLPRYDKWETVKLLAGLLVVPDCQPNNIRLETLVHMVVASANGTHVPRRDDLVVWFNRHFLVPGIAAMEDPLEDVFVGVVVDDSGSHRVIEGIWESNAYWLQSLLQTMRQFADRKEIAASLAAASALLALSDEVAERMGLERNTPGAGEPKGRIYLPPRDDLAAAGQALVFSDEQLRELRIDPADLAPFVFVDGSEQEILGAKLESSPLESRPLLRKRNEILLSLPAAVGAAIRRHVLKVFESLDLLRAFETQLLSRQVGDVTDNALKGIGGRPWDFTNMPVMDGRPPANMLLIPIRHDCDRHGLVCVVAPPLAADIFSEFDPVGILQRWTPTGAYLSKAMAAISATPGFRDGILILCAGGLGGMMMMLPQPELPPAWACFSLSIPNLITLAAVPEMDLAAISRYARQLARLDAEGMEVMNLNGDFNLISAWREQGYQLLPPEVPLDTTMFIPRLNSLLDTRLEVRSRRDVHAVWRASSGRFFTVEKKEPYAPFTEERKMPLYASRELASAGELAAIVEAGGAECWITGDFPRNSEERASVAYQLWDCIAHWAVPVLKALSKLFERLDVPCEIRMNIPDLHLWWFTNQPSQAGQVSLRWSILEPGLAEIVVDQDFFRSFSVPTNSAEREIVRTLIKVLSEIFGRSVADVETRTIRDAIIPEGAARYFHVTAANDASFAASPGPATAWLVREDAVSEQWLNQGMAERALAGKVITDRKGIRAIVRRSVSRLKAEIEALLGPLSLTAVAEKCLAVMDSLHRDDHSWKVSAAALLALHADTKEVYAEARAQESKRAAAGTSARGVLETAMYACRFKDGQKVSRETMDELLAKMQVIIEVANHDPVDWAPDFPIGKVAITPSGRLSPENLELSKIRNAYHTSVMDAQFDTEALSYADFFTHRKSKLIPPDFAAFDEAMASEFGLSATQMAEFSAKLNGRGTDLVAARWPMLRSGLVSFIREELGVNEEAASRFVAELTLAPRQAWNDLPPGCEAKDTFPWLFKRRLSFIRRPLVQLTDDSDPTYLVAPVCVRNAAAYLVTNAYEGEFPREFFATDAMRAYHHKAIDRRSKQFVEATAATMRAAGYQVRTDVQMTEVGAHAVLGDVDVLAWRYTPRETVALECKALRNALSIQELIAQLEEFKASGRDSAGKHLDRMSWLTANRAKLASVTGVDSGILHGAIATSHRVPMQFAPENAAGLRFLDPAELVRRHPPV